jgi:ABC-type transporter Mla subunit MlaD
VLTEPDASLTKALKNFEEVGSNLKVITGKGGQIDSALLSLQSVLTNVKGVTTQLQKDNNLEKTIANFKDASAELNVFLESTNRGVGRLLPRFGPIIDDLKELTGKLKEQPWRIVWPSTIKYQQKQQPEGATPGNRHGVQ